MQSQHDMHFDVDWCTGRIYALTHMTGGRGYTLLVMHARNVQKAIKLTLSQRRILALTRTMQKYGSCYCMGVERSKMYPH
jgi:hypothetical protein